MMTPLHHYNTINAFSDSVGGVSNTEPWSVCLHCQKRDGINIEIYKCLHLVRALTNILPQHLAFWSWFLFEDSASLKFCTAGQDWTGPVTSQYEMQEMELFSLKSQFSSIFYTKYQNISCTMSGLPAAPRKYWLTIQSSQSSHLNIIVNFFIRETHLKFLPTVPILSVILKNVLQWTFFFYKKPLNTCPCKLEI